MIISTIYTFMIILVFISFLYERWILTVQNSDVLWNINYTVVWQIPLISKTVSYVVQVNLAILVKSI